MFPLLSVYKLMPLAFCKFSKFIYESTRKISIDKMISVIPDDFEQLIEQSRAAGTWFRESNLKLEIMKSKKLTCVPKKSID